MTIRWHVFLGLMPVFAALALIGNSTRYYFERQATLDGLRNEAGTFAASLAGFEQGSDWARLRAGQGGHTEFGAALEKLDRWNALRGVIIWDARDRRPLFQWRNGVEIPVPSRALLAKLAADAPFGASNLVEPVSGSAIVAAYARIRDAASNPAGIIGVSVDASVFADEMRALRRTSIRNSVLILLLGAGLSLLFSTRLSFELRRLTRAAAASEGRHYVPPPAGLIAEVSDVSETFSVLDGVTNEVRAKSHRAFVENEQFRTEDDLLQVYRAEFLAPVAVVRAGLRIEIGLAGTSAAIFREVGEDPDGGRLCFGSVTGPANLETSVLASAAGREIMDRLARGEPPAGVLAATQALFPLATATILTWSPGANTVSRCDSAQGQVSTTAIPMPNQDADVVCHSFWPVVPGIIDVYLDRFPDEHSGRRLADIIQLAGATSGVVAVLTRA